MIEQGHIEELYDHPSVERLVARSEGVRGIRRLRRVLGIARPGTTLTKSGLEETMLALCRRAGLPEPEVNAYILLGGVHTEVDFLWRRERVVVEVDSWKYHRQRGHFERDRRRDQLLELEGWGHARVTDTEINSHAAQVTAVLGALLEAGAARWSLTPG